MAVDNIIKLGFVLSATDKMTKVIEGSVKQSKKHVSDFEKFTANVAQRSMQIGKRMLGVGTAIGGAMFASAKGVAAYGDKIVDASQKTGLGIVDLQKFAYAAERNNVSFESFTGNITKLNKNIIDLQATGKKGSNVFRDLGIRTGNLNDTLIDTAKIFARVPDGAAKSALAMELFGKSGAEMIPFLNAGEEGIARLIQEAERMGVVLSEDAIKQADNFDTALGNLKNTLRGASMTIGSQMIPYVEKTIKWIQEVAEKFVSWSKSNTELLNRIIGLVGGFAKLLIVGGVVMTILGGLAAVGLKVARVIRTLGVVFNGLKVAVGFAQFAIAGMRGTTVAANAATRSYMITQSVATTKTTAYTIGAKLAAAAQWSFNTALTGAAFVKTGVVMAAYTVKTYALAAAQKVAAAAVWLFNLAINANPVVLIITAIIAAVALLSFGIYKLIKNWDKVKEWFANLWEKVKDIFISVWEWVKKMFLNYTPYGLIIKHWDKISEWFSALWERVKGIFVSAWDGIKAWFISLKDSFFDIGKSIIQGIIDGIKAMIGKVVDIVTGIGTAIKDKFTGLLGISSPSTIFVEYGLNITQGLTDGISGTTDKLNAAVANIGNTIKDRFTGLLEIGSPSKVFAEYGLNITRGLTGGIGAGTMDAARATEGLAMQTVRAATSDISNITNVGNTDNAQFGGVTLNYSPVINISGGGGSASEDLIQALRSHKSEIARMMREVLENQRRISFVNKKENR